MVGEADIPFPLTPALSLRERVNPAPPHEPSDGWIRAEHSRVAPDLQSLFPLPKGEGRVRGNAAIYLAKIGNFMNASARVSHSVVFRLNRAKLKNFRIAHAVGM